MPHVAVKLHAGRTDGEKQDLADRITEAVKAALGSSDESVSVSIEDVEPADWMSQVYGPEIESKPDTLFKKPGYGPLR